MRKDLSTKKRKLNKNLGVKVRETFFLNGKRCQVKLVCL